MSGDGETVWITSRGRSGSVRERSQAYHLDESCMHIRGRQSRPVDRSIAADQIGLECCQTCSGEYDRVESPDFSAYNDLVAAAEEHNEGGEA